ncbi:hypothetical protein NUU61_005041 [Penicillium alfredii]|uniref:SH3 domain-containing protein n=1 Tax=Penicillium alfredii TaxID=1506179 RepID=A0A9W9K7I1_9EURO|nr:uncharacterized protein NUU61_005041 [Penicillium alfredii]KAJ5095685.1 hypothetical protein NUU61_005041 [Penicillium alfredii]
MMSSPTSTQNTLSVLPPLVTDQGLKRSSTNVKDRLSTYSNVSFASQNRSRPGSHVFPVFHSSLPYALVRDFAYPSTHHLHYGPPPPRASGVSSPASEHRRLSDPPTSWDTSRGPWASGWNTDTNYGHQQQLPAMSFGDGPPYSEDEDLHSPVMTTARHRKKASVVDLNGTTDNHGLTRTDQISRNEDRGTFVGLHADGSETYYVNDGDSGDDGPGGEYVTYPAHEGRYSYAGYGGPGPQQGYEHDPGFTSDDETAGDDRYASDFQFAVGCPDEEMNGKAVALFDFTREHENELPLTEGQVIYVSYRHGQGWLVAEDPKTGENGLVPEEFVRLLRDIEGGLTSLNDETTSDVTGNGTDFSESGPVSLPAQNERSDNSSAHDGNKGANGDTPVTIQIQGPDASSETEVSKSKTAGGNRSNMLAKT